MIALPWDPLGYTFWYIVLGIGVGVAERIRPWRRQPFPRAGLVFDLLLVIFNGLLLGSILNGAVDGLAALWASLSMHAWQPPALIVLAPWAQFAVVLVAKDLAEWLVHNLLHRVSWLWNIHKLHHSITLMDWLGNMRFHWLEVVVYRSLLWLPMSLLLVEWQVALALAVVSTLIGHLNHANLRLDWGPLRYVLNSPRFHVWHHDRDPATPHGTNFAIIFSCWDWLFGTACYPTDREQPDQLGYTGQTEDPWLPARRWFWPFG